MRGIHLKENDASVKYYYTLFNILGFLLKNVYVSYRDTMFLSIQKPAYRHEFIVYVYNNLVPVYLYYIIRYINRDFTIPHLQCHFCQCYYFILFSLNILLVHNPNVYIYVYLSTYTNIYLVMYCIKYGFWKWCILKKHK